MKMDDIEKIDRFITTLRNDINLFEKTSKMLKLSDENKELRKKSMKILKGVLDDIENARSVKDFKKVLKLKKIISNWQK